MPRKAFNYKKAPKGQKKAHISMATNNVLRAAGGDLARVTKALAVKQAKQLDVPLDDLLVSLRSRGAPV